MIKNKPSLRPSKMKFLSLIGKVDRICEFEIRNKIKINKRGKTQNRK